MSILAIERLILLLTDIPTGILSDKIGRKKTASLGALSKVIGITLLALSDSSTLGIATAFLGSGFMGLSLAFFNGNNNAILYETLQILDKSDQLHSFLGRNINSMTQFGLFISAVIGGFVAQFKGFNVAIWLSVIPSMLCFFISFFIVETNINSRSGLKALAHLKRSFRELFNNKASFKIFTADLLEGLSGAAHRMEVLFAKMFLPIWGIGVFKGAVHLNLSISYRYSGKIIDKIGYKKSAIEGNIMFSVLQIAAYALGTVFSPVLIAAAYLFKGYAHNASKTLIIRTLSDKERATMDSILSMFNNLFFCLMLLAIGLLADRIGIAYAALTFIILRAAIIIPLYKSYFKNQYSYG